MQVLDKPRIINVLHLMIGDRESNLLRQVEHMLECKVDFVEIISNAPNNRELKYVTNSITSILKTFPESLISINTFKSKVALAAVEYGAVMINASSTDDFDQNMFSLVSRLKLPFIVKLNNNNSLKLLKEKGINEVILYPGFNLNIDLRFIRDLSLKGLDPYPILMSFPKKVWVNPTYEDIKNSLLCIYSFLKKNLFIRVDSYKEASKCIELINIGKS